MMTLPTQIQRDDQIFSIVSLHYPSLDCSMESASPLEHSCHYWLMEIRLSNQVIIPAKTRKGLLNRKQPSWEVFTWLDLTEIREKNSLLESSEQWQPHRQEPGVTAKLEGVMYLLKKGMHWTQKAEQVQWLLSGQCLTVVKLVLSQSRESGSRSSRSIATLGHSSSLAQAGAKGEGSSLNRLCR